MNSQAKTITNPSTWISWFPYAHTNLSSKLKQKIVRIRPKKIPMASRIYKVNSCQIMWMEGGDILVGYLNSQEYCLLLVVSTVLMKLKSEIFAI